MFKSFAARFAVLACSAVLTAVTAAGQSSGLPGDNTGFVALSGDEIKTGTIYGDSSKPGIYVTRNRFGPGSFSRPHFHDQARYVTVIKGTWWVALGPDADVFNPDKMTPMKAGSFVVHPAGGHHYDGAKDEEAIVQIMGMGPVRTTPIPQPGADTAGGGAPAAPAPPR